MTNYKIDKFLWQLGKQYLSAIIKADKAQLDTAKKTMIKKIKTKYG